MKNYRTLIIAGVFSALVIVGCSATKPAAQDKTSSKTAEQPMGTTVDYTNEKGELICPVLGEVIPSKDAAAGHQEYEGKTYYFCCAGCPEEFAADPAKFAK